jgi:hypothetical protein
MTRRGALPDDSSHSSKRNVFVRQDTDILRKSSRTLRLVMQVNVMSERTTSSSWAMGIVKALEMDGLDCRALFKRWTIPTRVSPRIR